MASDDLPTDDSDQITVMIVDDSAVVRGLIARMLEQDDQIAVVASVANGALAVTNLKRERVDVIILDIEMPVMDGLTALPKLLEVDPDVKVIMASTLTAKNAEISLSALQAGAADYLPKPSTSRELTGGNDFRREIVEKVKSLGQHRRSVRSKSIPSREKIGKPGAAPKRVAPSSAKIQLAKPPVIIPRLEILAIGSSTGGPQALFEVLKGLNKSFNLPILITQHMPPTFTAILAQHIEKTTGYPAREAVEGDILKSGQVYVAPGDYHMTVSTENGAKVLHLNQGPQESFCRPAVDPMLRSVAETFGKRALVLILTGMGYDGLKGSEVITECGGTVIAQDEESSVVWGMPGAVSEAGYCTAVLPLPKIAPFIVDYVSRASI